MGQYAIRYSLGGAYLARLANRVRLTQTKPRFSFSRTSSTRLASSITPRFRNGATLGKCRKNITYYDQANQLKPMRAEGLIGLANFSCCQDVLRRLDKTFQAFFARVRRGKKPGFPRFRSFRRYDSITFPSYGDGCRLLDGGKLRIQGAGLVKVKLHRPVEGKIVDPRGTSQVCVCGAAVPKTLAERWHECPVCGLSAPRNVVSAQVILERARIGRLRHNVEDVDSCVPREAVALQATE